MPQSHEPSRRLRSILAARPRAFWPLLVALSLVACGGQAPSSAGSTRPATTAESPGAAGRTPSPVSPSPGDPRHIFLIVMENKEEGDVLGSPDAPYLNQLAARYAVADHYYAIRHPSLPNYLALLGGDTFGVDSDCTDCFQDAPNLADRLEAKGLTWTSYQEDLPTPCSLVTDAGGTYALKHNPFLYFRAIRDDPARCDRVVPLSRLDGDLRSGDVPNFAWVTPNLVHDTHDGSVADGDRWLAGFVPQILASAAWQQGGQLIITWDEGSSDQGCCGGAAGGRVALLVIAPDGPHGYHSATPATHYGLLRTIEDEFGLTPLGHSGDAGVRPLADLIADTAGRRATGG